MTALFIRAFYQALKYCFIGFAGVHLGMVVPTAIITGNYQLMNMCTVLGFTDFFPRLGTSMVAFWLSWALVIGFFLFFFGWQISRFRTVSKPPAVHNAHAISVPPTAGGFFFDARLTKIGEQDGVGRYASSLATALAKLMPITLIIHDPRQLAALPRDVPYVVVNDPTAVWQELFLPWKLNRLGASVVYNPLFVMGTWGRKYKLIFTQHDLTCYKFRNFPPSYLPAYQRAVWWLFHRAYWPGRLVLGQADYVVTVSETSKREILEHRLTDRPLSVIYNAPPSLPHAPTSNHIKRELVFMGTLMPFKNAELLMRALPLLPEYHVHLTGGGTPDRIKALTALAGDGVSQVTFWNHASDKDYAKLLSTATALVSASKAEGFGLPLVEAMAAGMPVVCSDLEVFHEVAADAALFFDPDSPEEFAIKIRELGDPAVRARLVKSGSRRAQFFSWDRSAAKLQAIMQQLAAQSEHEQPQTLVKEVPGS